MAPARQHLVAVSIGIAAARAGVHPQTLREYERKGLIRPRRTNGGARRYGEEEIERLRRIQRLTEQGLSLSAVAYVLSLEDKVDRLTARLRELEGRDGDPTATHGGPPLPLVRSMSLELVHVPRPRRGPRWRNEG